MSDVPAATRRELGLAWESINTVYERLSDADARIMALEAQVHELAAHQHAVGVGGGISTTPIAAPKDNADNAPNISVDNSDDTRMRG